MPRPFQRLRFGKLPERPRRAHPYMDLRARDVRVASRCFGDVDIHVREHGDGPPLLLIHGLMTTGYSWRYVVETLGRSFRVCIPDLVGCGRSDKPDGDYSPRNVAASIGELMHALDIRGCDVVGNSMGGYLCMWLALDDSEAIGRLVNIHSPAVPMARLWALKAVMSLPGSDGLLRWLVQRDPLRWVHRNVHYHDETLKSLEEAHEYGDPLATTGGYRAFRRYLTETMDPSDLGDFVRALRERPFPIDLRLIYSTVDPMVPPSVGKALAELVPDADMIWIDDCSHFAHVDAPDRIAAWIADFFRP